MYQDSVVRDFNWPFAMVFGISGKDDANDRSVLSVIKVSLCCWSSRCLRGAHPLRLFGCSLVRRRSWPMPPICSSPHINSRENLARSHRIGIKIRGRSRAAVRHHRAQSLRLSKQTPGGPDSRGRASFDDVRRISACPPIVTERSIRITSQSTYQVGGHLHREAAFFCAPTNFARPGRSET